MSAGHRFTATTQVYSDTSDFSAGARDVLVTFSQDTVTFAGRNGAGVKLAGLSSTPSADGDAITLGYYNSHKVSNWIGGARARTTTALPAYTHSAGVLTATSNGQLAAQDGVTLAQGEYLLVVDETAGNAPYNGRYVVTTLGDGSNPYVLTRADDMNDAADFVNATVSVAEGTTHADTNWQCTNNADMTVGVTAVAFASFGGGGGGTPDDNSVSTVKIQDNAVTYAKIQTMTQRGALITTSGNTDPTELAPGATAGHPLVSGGAGADLSYAALGADGLAADSVVEAKIQNSAVTTMKIADTAVNSDKLATDAVVEAKIQNSAVTADKLASNAVTTAKIVDEAVTLAKLEKGIGGAGGQILVTANTTDVPAYVTPTGDVTISNTGVTAIGNDKVVNAMIANDAVQADQLAADAVTEMKIADNAVSLAKLADFPGRGGLIMGGVAGAPVVLTPGADNLPLVSAGVGQDLVYEALGADGLASDSVTTAKIVDEAVTLAKLAKGSGGAGGQILVTANTTDAPTYVTPTGDVTISNTGVTAIGADKVTGVMIAHDLRHDDDQQIGKDAAHDIDFTGNNTTHTVPASAIHEFVVDATQRLEVNTNGIKYTGNLDSGSDPKWKDIKEGGVISLEAAWDGMDEVEGIEWKWLPGTPFPAGVTSFGINAEQIQKIVPGAVHHDGKLDGLVVQDKVVGALNIQFNKANKQHIVALEGKVASLESQVQSLQLQLAQVMAQMDEFVSCQCKQAAAPAAAPEPADAAGQ